MRDTEYDGYWLTSFHTVAFVGAAFVMLIGVLGVLGWVLDVEMLKGLFSRGLTIKFNASLGLMLLGIAVALRVPYAQTPKRKTASQILAAVVGLLGGLTLIEYLAGVNLGIDQLFFVEQQPALATPSPNRMGMPAALAFLLAAIGILAFDKGFKGDYRVADVIGGMILILGMVPLVGYMYGAHELYGVPGWTSTAFQTAFALVALGTVFLCARPESGIICIFCQTGSVATLARRLILPVALFPLLVGWVQVRVARTDALGAPFISVVGAFLIVLVLVGLLLALLQNMRRAQAERTRVEAEIWQGREQLATALASADAGAWEWDFASGVFSWSAADELPVEGTYDSWLQSIHVEDRESVDKLVRSATVMGQSELEMRYRVQQPQGPIRWIRSSGKIYYTNEGRPLRALGISRDVTGEQLREEELRRTADRLELMYQTVQLLSIEDPQKAAEALMRKVLVHLECQVYLGFMISDGDMHMRLDTFAGITEQEAAAMAELPLSGIVCGQVIKRGTRLVVEDLSSRANDPTIRHLVALGVEAYVCHPLLQDGRAIGTVGFGSRTTRRFTLENLAVLQAVANHMAISIQQSRSKDALAKAVAAKSEFLAGASHELRKPLAPILNGAEIIELDASLPAATRHTATMIRRQAEAEAALINDLLNTLRSRREVLEPADAPPIVQGQLGLSDALEPHRVGPPLRLLLVDSHADAVQSLAHLLVDLGHDVRTASGFNDALRVAGEFTFDVLLTEEVFHDGDGTELLKTLGKQRAVHAVIISGYGSPDRIARSRDAGFAAHLVKPVSIQKVIDAIAAAAQPQAVPVA